MNRNKLLKKTFIAAALIVCGSFVQAHHHRGHALYFMERFHAQIDLTRNYLTSFEARNEHIMTPEQKNAVRDALSRINQSQAQARNVEQNLRDCDTDLVQLRRKVNSPSMSGPLSTPHSVLKQLKNANYAMGKIEDLAEKAAHERTAAAAWELMDNVLWHINDAIKEEIYEDDAFFGHEPGFDAVEKLAAKTTRPPQEEYTEERHWVICE